MDTISEEWRDQPYCSYKNWHTWETRNCLLGSYQAVYDASVDLVRHLGKRPTKVNCETLRLLAVPMVSKISPSVDPDKVDWKSVYECVAEYA